MDHFSRHSNRTRPHTAHSHGTHGTPGAHVAAPPVNDGWEYDCGFGTGITASQTHNSLPSAQYAPPVPQRPPRTSSHSANQARGWGAPPVSEPTIDRTTASNPWSSGFTWHPPFTFPNPSPPVAHSTPSPEEPPVPTTMPTMIPDSPIAHESTYTQDEEDGYFSYHPRTLRTREANDGTEYLSIPDVFHHVTLGGRLSTYHLMELGMDVKSYVFATRGEDPIYDKVSITKRDPVLGINKTIQIIPYKWSDYGFMAQACLQFAIDHPEYLAR
jgi:hypothetical protein